MQLRHMSMQLPNSIMQIPVDEDQETTVFNALEELNDVTFEPVGRWFDIYAQRRRQKHAISYHSIKSSSSEEEDVSEEEENEADDELLRSLDPKDWKNQDHYAILGLAKKRIDSTENDIKKAYKKKVLKHHPDKRKARGLPVGDGEDDYFTCISRAWEVLGNPAKRRAYDSVDSFFDDRVPGILKDRKKFFKVFKPVFETNARWNAKKKKRVPDIGDINSTEKQVNDFYNFWYSFESWREYSYLDEEDSEKGENRLERRYLEKQNKAERTRRKKEEIDRIRTLVDNANRSDPRVLKFKEEEKARDEARKQAKLAAAKKKADEANRIKQEALDAERKIREEEEAKAKAIADAARKEKEELERKMTEQRDKMRATIVKYKYFSEEGQQERIDNMMSIDLLDHALSLLQIEDLNKSLSCGNKGDAQKAFFDVVSEVKDAQERERNALYATQHGVSATTTKSKQKKGWGDEEVALLTKGLTVYPVGTVKRWEAIAGFITQHMPSSNRTDKEVLLKVKEVQKHGPVKKHDANQKAFDKFEKNVKPPSKVDVHDISQRTESAAEQQVYEMGSNPAPWNKDEQSVLEKALRKFPASTAQRWDKIAEELPNRTKKDCMKRYKELVEMVQAKKLAAAKAKSS